MAPETHSRPSRTLRFLGFALSAVLLAPPVHARQSPHGVVVGSVVADGSRVPLRGATVAIEQLGVATETRATGTFRLAGIRAGRHELTVRLPGYQPVNHAIDVQPGRNELPEIVLEKLPMRLPEIRVLRERIELGRFARETAGSVHVIEREGMPTANALYGDVHQLLRRVPGVAVQEEDGYGLRPNIGMRGTGSERSSKITVMEDGVLIAPAPYAAPAAYYFPLAGRMEAVEVRKGSSQVKFGPRTVGGAINLVSTSIPQRLTVRADVAGGSDATRRISALAGDDTRNLGWMVETYQVETDGFKRLAGPGQTGFDLQDYIAKFRVNTNPTAQIYQEIEVKAGYYDERSDETYLGLTDDDFARDPRLRYAASQLDRMDAEHRQLQLRYFMRPSDRFDVTATAYRNDFRRNWYKLQSVGGEGIADVVQQPQLFAGELAVLQGADSDDDALRVRANNREYYSEGIQISVGTRLGHTAMLHDVEVGVRMHRDEEDRFQHEDGFRMTGSRMVPTSTGPPGSQANRVSRASALSVYVQDEIAVGPLLVTPGVRYETIDFRRIDYATDDPERRSASGVRDNSVSALIPGIGAVAAVTSEVGVFAGVHRGFGPPGPGAEAQTEAERSINYEGGVRMSFPGARAEVVGFFNDYENVLGAATLATGESGAGDLFNGGAVHVTGFETSLEVDPLARSSGRFTAPLGVSLTYTDASFRTDFESDYEPWGTVTVGDELPYLPRWLVHATWTLRSDRWKLGVEASYIGEMRTVAGQGPIPADRRIDAALVFDAGGEFGLTSWGRLYVAARNLFDQEYAAARRPAGLRPGLPRTILAGLKIEP